MQTLNDLTQKEIKSLVECNTMKNLENLIYQGIDVNLSLYGYTKENVGFNWVALDDTEE